MSPEEQQARFGFFLEAPQYGGCPILFAAFGRKGGEQYPPKEESPETPANSVSPSASTAS